MMRKFFVVGAAAFALGSAQPRAQTLPDLSGTWTVVEPAVGEPATMLRGGPITRLTITQDSRTVTLDGWTTGVWSITATKLASPTAGQRGVYSLDGSESVQSVRDALPPPPNADPLFLTRSVLIKSVARASWVDRQLVIVTHNTYTVTAPYRIAGAAELQKTVWEKFSLESGNRLVVDHVLIADPLPWATNVPVDPPVSSQVLYKKIS